MIYEVILFKKFVINNEGQKYTSKSCIHIFLLQHAFHQKYENTHIISVNPQYDQGFINIVR